VALHTQKNSDELLQLNKRQLQILEELRELRQAIEEQQ